jgi:hypothetical protein
MPTRKKHREALASLGFTVEEYWIGGWPPVWGTAIQKNGKDVMVIETHGCHTDNDKLRNKYMLKYHRGVAAGQVGIFKLKREALTAFARMQRG